VRRYLAQQSGINENESCYIQTSDKFRNKSSGVTDHTAPAKSPTEFCCWKGGAMARAIFQCPVCGFRMQADPHYPPLCPNCQGRASALLYHPHIQYAMHQQPAHPPIPHAHSTHHRMKSQGCSGCLVAWAKVFNREPALARTRCS
jgi:hypothetical protein